MMLITNYITSAWRNILRHKLFSIINILGLAIGLAAVMLIALYVRYETSYDSFWKNADNIYRVHMQSNIPGLGSYKFTRVSVPAFHIFKNNIPQIEYGSRIFRRNTIFQSGDDYIKEKIEMVDEDFFNIFDLTVLSGSLSDLLSNQNTIALNETIAMKYFPNSDPIGKTITVDFDYFKQDYSVSAVFKNLPQNSQIDLTAFVLFDEEKWINLTQRYRFLYAPEAHIYFTLVKGAKIEQINQMMPQILDDYFEPFEALKDNAKNSDYLTFPSLNIKDLHLEAEGIGEHRPRGSMSDIINYSIVAAFVLVIAAINFMNLSTARASTRAKEVSVRKLVGAARRNLVVQFLGESTLFALISLFFSLCFLETSLPFFNDHFHTSLQLNYYSFDVILITLISCIIGLSSGAYPAFILSSFRPSEILKSNQSIENSRITTIRNLLVIIQFSAAITLISSTGIIYSQILYTNIKDLGFNKEKLLILEDTDTKFVSNKMSLMIAELKRINGVTNVTSSSFSPGRTNEFAFDFRTDAMPRGSTVTINGDGIGYDFFKTYQIDMIAGREFDRNRNDIQASYQQIKQNNGHRSPIIINKASVDYFGFTSSSDAMGKNLYMKLGSNGDELERNQYVIGVVDDFHTYSLKEKITPTIYYLTPDKGDIISIRYNGNKEKLIADIQSLWKQELPNAPFNYRFISDIISDQYETDLAVAFMFAAFSGLAIFIACLGLFGLAAFTAERRTKEIGVRKVFGAEIWQIVKLLVWQFSKPVLIANIIAWPIAYLAMSRWLESFVYRIDDMVIIALCLLAGLTALLIAWATVAGNSYAVARQNPIKALRYE